MNSIVLTDTNDESNAFSKCRTDLDAQEREIAEFIKKGGKVINLDNTKRPKKKSAKSHHADFNNQGIKSEMHLRQQFSQHAVDIGLLTQLSGLIDAGKLPKSVLYDKAREFNLISGELSNDEIDGLIEQPSMTYEAFNQFRKAQGSSVK